MNRTLAQLAHVVVSLPLSAALAPPAPPAVFPVPLPAAVLPMPLEGHNLKKTKTEHHAWLPSNVYTRAGPS